MSTDEYDRHGSLRYLALVSVSILGAIVIARVVFSNQISQGFSASGGLSDFDFVTPAVFSLVTISVLFYGLRRRGEQVARLAIAAIMTAGTLSGLLLLKIWFDASFGFPALFYLCAAPLGYLGLYLSVRGYFGSLSERKISALLSLSPIFIGALAGVVFPELFTVSFLIALSLLDFLMVETDVLKRIVGLARFERIVSLTTIPLQRQVVGIGDLLAYSMLSVATLRSGNLYVAAATVILILLGSAITHKVAESRLRIPGLPIPICLGALPYLLGLFVP
ncbi:MAG TPA: hypothetical protein VFV92_16515 [Candidatus Bathyarchaeia archaeon]|nr:hypothetical protein [Candidatus Bathyarchaeia archaeon]